MKVMIFDVGGTEIKYSVMDDAMNSYESGSVPTPSDSQEHFLETMAEIYRPHKEEVDGIALSLPGFIDAEHGVVKGGGAPSIIYNIGTPVGPRLAEKCGCKVWIENDGKAAAIAELKRGALKGCSNAAVFVIGTGVGGGLIVNGQLVRGRDFTAGEYSFMNTNADEWHNGKKTMACQCSTTALLDAYRERKALAAYRAGESQPEAAPLNGKIFFDAVHAGEPAAVETLEQFCMAVDVQIYNLCVLLDLEKVAIGGGISCQPILIETLNRVYEEQILKGHPFSEEQARSLARPEIVACAFGNRSNQIGALVSYLNTFYPQK